MPSVQLCKLNGITLYSLGGFVFVNDCYSGKYSLFQVLLFNSIHWPFYINKHHVCTRGSSHLVRIAVYHTSAPPPPHFVSVVHGFPVE